MRYVVAVSGGVDSVVLLDTLVRVGGHELIVAHFDHGIRSDSAADARFVKALAKRHNLMFASKREKLGTGASEELARERRYVFLRGLAEKHKARIVTAHHADDIVETIAINLSRGTGWRGLAVLDAEDVSRPLLRRSKQEIINYALHYRLEWVEDNTNRDVRYLRNQVRQAVGRQLSLEQKHAALELWQGQLDLKQAIDAKVTAFLKNDHSYTRHFFIMIDSQSACEILRMVILRATSVSPTRPQVERALLAIKAARTNTQHDVGGHALLKFTTATFIVETP